MFETVLFTFIVMLADVVVTIPMIIAGAFLPRKYMLVLAIIGGAILGMMTINAASGDLIMAKLAARIMAMTFAGFIGNIIYIRRMATKARLAGAIVSTQATPGN